MVTIELPVFSTPAQESQSTVGRKLIQVAHRLACAYDWLQIRQTENLLAKIDYESGDVMSDTINPELRHQHCSICSQLKDYEYAIQTVGRPDEDTFLPEIARNLKNILELKPGYDRYMLLRQCPECATYYTHKVDYEYLATGSEDEQILKRLSDDEASGLLAQLPRK
jgi:hypothetical protein